MAKIIASSSSLQAACENLVVAANQAGGRDNITVILAEPPAG
jgi:serine/threonine protein phosphatase PrpC